MMKILDERIIISPSQEIIKKAIRTLPIEFRWGDIGFLAESLTDPDYKTDNNRDDEKRAEYLEQCSKKGIIPFSGAEIQLTNSNLDNLPLELSFRDCKTGEERLELISRLLIGGKINNLNIYMIGSSHFEAFRVKNGLMDRLLENGYAFQGGNLNLMRGSDESYIMEFSKEQMRFNLASNEALSKKSYQDIFSWFESLNRS